MNRIFLATVALEILSIVFTGCSDKSTVKRETTITTPGGKTTVTTQQEVKKSGENPPPARP